MKEKRTGNACLEMKEQRLRGSSRGGALDLFEDRCDAVEQEHALGLVEAMLAVNSSFCGVKVQGAPRLALG
jgi:hypothetical protein